MASRRGKNGNSGWLYFWGAPKSLQKMTTAMKWKDTCSLEEKLTNLDSIFKSRDITLLTKIRLVKAMVFPVVMYGYEGWTIRKPSAEELMLLNCGVGEDSWVPWTVRRSKPVNPKGNQSWITIGKIDAEGEAPILWPPDAKSLLIGKDPDLGRDWGARGEGDDRGWDGWITSPTQCTWVWVNSRSQWWTGRPGLQQIMGLQGVGHNWATEMNWTELNLMKVIEEYKKPGLNSTFRKWRSWHLVSSLHGK